MCIKKKKIGLILPTRPQDGGQHQYALIVVQSLLERDGIDYDLVVLCGNTFWYRWCGEHGIKYIGYSLPKLLKKEQEFNYNFPLLAKIYNTHMTTFGKLIKREKIDILFSVHQGTFIPNYNVKIMSPVHDLMHLYEPTFPEVKNGFESRDIYMKCMAKYARCILVDSTLGKEQFEESYIPKHIRKLVVVSLPFVVPQHVWEEKEEYIEVPDKYVFYPAQFWKHKNHMNLLKAIKILKASIDDIHLILVGAEKNTLKEVECYIADNGLADNVKIMGFVSDKNITYLYKHAVGMVMPSYFGPTNMPPLEAMALGCPVAVSNKYAMPEQVGKAGLLFNPDSPEEMAECIRNMWMNENLRNTMKERGYKRVQRWTLEKFGERLRNTINRL